MEQHFQTYHGNDKHPMFDLFPNPKLAGSHDSLEVPGYHL